MKEFVLRFTIEELEVLDEALGNMPYKKVAGIFQSINTQIQKTCVSEQDTINTRENGTIKT